MLQSDYCSSVICITSHNYHFFFIVKTFKIYSLSNFYVYNTVLLTTITMLCIRSPEHIYLKAGSLYSLSGMSLNQHLDTQTVVYLHNRIVLHSKRSKFLIHTATWVNRRDSLPRKRSQYQKAIYSVIPFL